MSLAGASGLIGTAVGLAVTVGVLGLAFNFANKAVESASDRPRRSNRRQRQQPAGLFDIGNFGGQTRSKRRSRQPDIFGGNLF